MPDPATPPSAPSTSAWDRGPAGRRWLLWFLAGVTAALVLQLLQVEALGGRWDALLAVGEDSELRPVIEAQLDNVTLVAGSGHDGQISYVVALDPLGAEHAPLIPDAGYRWRRVLYPLVAGIGGLVDGEALLLSLVLWSAIGMGLATAAVVEIGRLLGLGRWVAVAVLANPGIWFSVQLLTVDALAIGLSLTGLALFLHGHALAVPALALAALAKDQYLLFALAVGAYALVRGRRTYGISVLAGASVTLASWATVITIAIGDGFGAEGNLALPFAGIAEGVGRWGDATAEEAMLGIFTITTMAAAVVLPALASSRILRWVAWPWVALGVVTSRWVWQTGNNAARVFLPFFVLAVIALVDAATPNRRKAVEGELQLR